ncbi:hypothetical protein [Loktanella sp. Alg231-35]|uniref:hypothetical protein n=1 Tax=Loktanella sp. Alg231-35 TaxID=1922220 RepID=UPI00131F312A|nr:hypothetical protein [Loktanella sp. Alg231-35]
MKHVEYPLKPVPSETADVIVLPRLRCANIDPDPLARLVAEADADADWFKAEDVMCRMLEDAAAQLDLLQRHLSRRDFAAMGRPSRRIETVATHLGLTEVATAAGHVGQCASQKGGPALDATLARLERGFDVAVCEVWNFREM